MNKKITLKAEDLHLPSNIEIFKYVYKLNTKEDFTGVVIANVTTTDVSYSHVIDFNQYNRVYAKIDYILKDTETNEQTLWSSFVTMFTAVSEKIIEYTDVIFPPKIVIDENRLSLEKVLSGTVKPPIFYKGTGNVVSLSSRIKDMSNNIILARENDEEFKDYFEFPVHNLDYEYIILEIEYNFDRDVYNPVFRQLVKLANASRAVINIDKDVLYDGGIPDTISVLVSSGIITNLEYKFFTTDKNLEIHNGSIDGSNLITVPVEVLENRTEVLLWIKTTTDAGVIIDSFILPIVRLVEDGNNETNQFPYEFSLGDE